PWLDLRRIAGGLERLPAGPLEIAEPSLHAPRFYEELTGSAYHTGAVRALRQAWVAPALGEPYLAIGVDLYQHGRGAHDAVRAMMGQCIGSAPAGFSVATVSMADEYDPVAMWMGRYARPFFDREGPQPQPAASGPLYGGGGG